MPPNVHTYYFGRLNLMGAWEDKQEFLYKALKSGAVESKRGFKYGIFDVQEISLQGQKFAHGRLVKYKPVLEGEVVDEQKGKVVEGGLPHGVVAKSDFFLHYHSEVIAYRPIANRLSSAQFREMFARLIETAHHNFFISASLEVIEEEFGIIEAVRRFQVVQRIVVEVHPTNPSNRKTYQRIDERLKRLKAQRMKQSIEGGEHGLNKDALEEDDIYAGLVMAADGYGRGRVQGILDGAKVTISTGQSPIKKEVLFTGSHKEVLRQLLPVFERIWERMNR